MPDQSEPTAQGLVAAVLAVMPIAPTGDTLTGTRQWPNLPSPDDWCAIWGDPEPLAAKYAAAALGWVVDWVKTTAANGECYCSDCLLDVIGEITADQGKRMLPTSSDDTAPPTGDRT